LPSMPLATPYKHIIASNLPPLPRSATPARRFPPNSLVKCPLAPHVVHVFYRCSQCWSEARSCTSSIDMPALEELPFSARQTNFWPGCTATICRLLLGKNQRVPEMLSIEYDCDKEDPGNIDPGPDVAWPYDTVG
jgi:hypothetical protein